MPNDTAPDTSKLLFGKRKFTIALAALVASFVLALWGVVDAEAWWKVTTAIVGLYGVAEAGEGAAHAIANRTR